MSETNEPPAAEGDATTAGGATRQTNNASSGGSVYAALYGDVIVNPPPPPGAAPARWLTPSAAYDTLAPHGRQHRWALRGREDVLAQLTEFASADSSPGGFGVLVGPAGQGKSRLLQELAETVEAGGRGAVRVLGPGHTEPAAAAQLPAESRLLVLIEDAHQRAEYLAGVLRDIRQERPGARVLLSIQPSGWALLRNAFRQVGVDHSQVPAWELQELTPRAATELAAEVLGASHAHLARRLAAAVGDCPLLLVFSAVRIADGRLDPGRLESDVHLHQELRDAFVGEALAGSPAPDTDRGLLHAVAALQPLRLAEQGFLDLLADLLDTGHAQLRAQLERLIRCGVLTRRGTSVRILPDLLGDVLLAEVALDPVTGASTGYLEQILARGAGVPVVHALVNTSRLDWQWSHLRSGGRSPVEELWQAVTDAYAHSGLAERHRLLGIAEQIAPYQPRRVLRLVQAAMDGARAGGEHPLECLAPVLAGVALDPAHLGEAMELLWLLGKDDLRPLAQHPDAPLRVLSDLASYAPGKPLLYQHAMVDAVARWAQQGPVRSTDRMPFALLDALFASEAMQARSEDGHTLTLCRLPVAYDWVAPIMQQAYEVLLDAYGAADAVRAGAAARSMEVVLRSLSERDAQVQVEALDALAERTGQVQPGPLVALAVRRAVHWHEQYGSPATAAAARAVVEALPDSVTHRLAVWVYSDWYDWLESAEEGDTQKAQAHWFGQLDRVVADLGVLPEDAVWGMLRDLLTDGAQVFPDSPPASAALVEALTRVRPSFAAVLVREAAACGDLLTLGLVAPALAALWSADTGTAREAAEKLASAGSAAGARAVVQAGRARLITGESLHPDEYALARQLAAHADARVRAEVMDLAITMLRHTAPREQAIALLCSVAFADVAFGAAAFGWAFVGPRALSWAELTPPQRAFCQGELVGTATLRDHRAQRALAALSDTHADEALTVLMQRVEAWEEELCPGYEPLPYRWSAPLAFGRSPGRAELLRRLQQWLAADRRHPWRRELYGGVLFASVAGEAFDAEVKAVIADAVRSGDEQQVSGVTPLLAHAPQGLVWEEPQFVADLLIAAARHSRDLYNKVGSSLFSSVTTGMKTTSPGQPYPRDLDLREKAAQVRATLPPGSPHERLYAALEEHADREISRALTEDLYTDLRRQW
ncbi:ATP-binding protein [Streptomyces paromomycinus]|uniref:Uncharacterized protein n=1 Tax=Streptomyces paromomycinus TaxID=92743 RepID=A0A401VTP7_STREY|nr:ATP-binding protein [Streptomyces paromomycinus]GCD40353.1 hypothetical protein GKJPGBOP_00002 [Streptomyces paromomycinus]